MTQSSKTKKQKQPVDKTGLFSLGSLFVGKEKDFLIDNLSMLVKSGMGLAQALNAVQQDIRSKWLRQVVGIMEKDIESGYTLSKTFARFKLLPDYNLSLISIGEASGRLSENLQVIVKQREKDRIFKSKLRSAMMYPVFVLFLTLIVGVGIAWFILPRLSTVFASLKLELPVITKALVAVGDFIGQYGAQVVPAFLFLVFAVVYFVFLFSKTRFIGQYILFSLPAIKRLIQEVEVARFSYLLGTLLDASVPIIQSVKSVGQATGLRAYRKFYQALEQGIDQGYTFKQVFQKYKHSDKLIPAPVQQVIIAAEQSGNLSSALVEIGQSYEKKIDNTTKNLSVILEPVLLVIVWLGVVAVALAVILPIYSLIGGLRNPGGVSQKASPPATDVSSQVTLDQVAAEQVEINNDVVDTTADIVLPQLEVVSSVGYLNIRQEPSLTSEQIGRALSGQVYSYQQEQNGWYQIILVNDEAGWVSGQYVVLIDLE